MASSNVSTSNNQTSHLPDLGLGNQQAASTSPMRKPPSTTTSKSTLDSVTLATQNLSISSNEQASLPELSKFTLSPNAKIFVPKSQQSQPPMQPQQPSNVGAGKQYHSQAQHHSYNNQKHQNHHSKSNGSNGVSRNRGNQWQNNEPSYLPVDDNESEDFYALTYLTDFITQVSAMPHLYDEEILNLTEILNSCIDEDEEIVLQCIVNNIIDSAISEPNFRYSAVKLCDHLIHNLTTTSGITGKVEFKNVLLNRCQREHSRRDTLMRSSDKGDYLRGLTLFIADLSTKLTDEQILLNALPDLMKVLLSESGTPSANNVRTVVNALKLCGRKLESSRPEQFKEIVARLTEIAQDADSSISNAVTALLELIARQWQPPPPPPPLLNNPYASGVVDDPLPEEYEKTFHDDYNGYGSYPTYPMPYYDFGNGDEQNSEVADAFEEFLRTSGQLN